MRRFNGIVLVVIGLTYGVIGCSGKSDYKQTADLKKAPPVKHEEHEHGAAGPHGGSIVELGKEEFHAEVVVDDKAHALRVFVMGPDAKTAQSTSATEVTVTPKGKDALTLKPAPKEGDGEGKASRFELVSESAIHALLDAGFLHGELGISINGTPFKGEIDYHLDHIKHEHKDEAPAAATETTPDKAAPKSESDGEKPTDTPKEPESK